ncbi:aggrecan core protein [Oryzias latipes]|uniref:aggrecan core protein n=1 Tax=Oryzias latipes TaxID=8090 RepID=UPI000CE1E4BE|nr:aggrecan core protein [Oryzias latipes]
MIRLTLLTSLSLSLVSAAFDYISEAHSFMDPEDVLSVDIPLEEPQRPLLGSSLVLPCFFQDHTVPDPGAPVIPPLSHRIKWSFVTKKNVSTVLVALGGQVRIGKGYLDRVQLLNYPQTPEDASIRISELRSSDTGVYSCEVQLGIEDDHDFVQVYVTGVVFHYRSFMGRYALTFEEAKTTCSQNSAAIASPEQLQAAYDDGFHQCDAGWISDQTVRYPIHDVRVNCFGDKEDLPGVRNYGVRDPREKYDVYCFAEKMTGRVFFTTSVEKFTVSEAALACSRHGAQLATTGQLYIAWQGGMDVCNTGWLADLSVRYPINVRRPQCGGGLLGVRTVYLHPNQTGFPLPESRHGAFCYADSPDDKSLNSGSGSGDESGPWRVSTVTKDPQLLFSWVTSESEVVGEMETQASSALNVTNFENPKMLVSPTVIITEAMEAINRPGVGKEPNTGSTMPPAGVVFHYRSHTGRYTFNFSEAQLACQSVGGSIASPQQLQAAYESGYHQCDAGWLLDQTVRYSIVVPRDKCAGDLGDQPGVRSYGMRPADERYDVYCYIEDLRGEVFHLESADGLTYDQAVLSCQEHGGILASTGELYAAWKTGFDKCRAGWLQDGSVRYPINIPRARCGGGKHGVHTVYAHPNQTGFPPREDRYDAYCIRSELLVQKNTLYEQYQHHLINNNCCTSTVNILLTANETGPNATDNHNKQLNHTSVADSFRLSLSSIVPSVYVEMSGSGSGAENTAPEFAGGCIFMNHCGELSGSDFGDQIISGDYTSSTDPPGGVVTNSSGSGLSGSRITDTSGSSLSESDNMDGSGAGLSGSSNINGSRSGFNGTNHVDSLGSGLSGSTSMDGLESGLSGSNSTDDTGSGLGGSNSTDYTGSGLSGSNSTDDTGSGLSGSNITNNSGSRLSGSDRTDDPGSGLSGSTRTDDPGSGLRGSNITDNSGSGLSGSDRTDDPGSGLSGSTRTDDPGSGLSGSKITENSGSSHSGFSSIDGSGSGFIGPSGVDNSGSGLSGLSSVDSSGLGLSGSNSTDDKGSGLSGSNSTDYTGSGLSGSNSTNDTGSGLSGSNITNNSGSRLSGSDRTDDPGSGLSGSTRTDDPGSGLRGSNITDNSGSGLSGSDRTDDPGSGLSGSTRTDDPGSGLSGSNITENSGSSHSGFSSIDGSGSGFIGPSGVDNSGSGLSGLSSVDSSGLGLGGSSTIIAIGSALSGYSNFDDSGSGLSGSSSTDGLESGLSGSSSADGSGSTLNGGGYNIPVVLSKLESFALEGGSALSREVKEGRPAILFFPSSVEGSGEPSGSRNLSWSGPKTGLASVDSGFSVESSGGSKALSGTTSGFILHQDFSGFKGFTSGSLSGSGSGQTREFEGSGNPQIFLIHDKLMDASVNQKQHELGGGPPVLSGSGDFSGSGILGGSFSDSDPESVSVLSSDVTSIGSGIPEVSVSSAAEHKQASEILLHSSGQGGEIQLSGLRGSTFVSQSVSGFSRSDIPSNEDKVKNLFLREDPNRQRKSRERGSEDHSGDGSQSGNGDAIATTAFFLGETSGHKQAEATTKPEKVTEVPVDGSEHVPAGLEARLITAEPAFEETSRITEDLDVCHPNPCANGATCVESADSFRCLCLPSYGGERCDVDEQHCAEGWTKFQGNCYLHVSKRETWPGAEQHCRSLNAHLVSIITPEEQQFVNANAKAYQWIGLNDRTVENDFHWTDCTPVQYQNWKQNQPDNYGSGENCVVMIWLKNGLWNDEPCHYHLPFTCKKGPVSCGEPPHVVNAVMFGRKRLEYPVRSIVRYQCNPGFRQRHSPVIRCQADGLWETPRVECVDAKARTRAGAGIIRRLPSATQGTARSS